MTSNTLTICSTSIRQDEVGRYCLNDLHKASGGLPSQRANYWLSNQQTQELIVEVGGAGFPAGPLNIVNDGFNNGTYVCEELVYAYAMWISPKFHLQVIRAYAAQVTGQAAIALPQQPLVPNFTNPAAAARAWALEYEAKQVAQAQTLQISHELAEAAPKAEALEVLCHNAKRSIEKVLRDDQAFHGVKTVNIKKLLDGIHIYRRGWGSQWRVYRNGRHYLNGLNIVSECHQTDKPANFLRLR